MLDRFRVCCFLLVAIALFPSRGMPAQALNVIPFPKRCELGEGSLSLPSNFRIVAGSESLVALANVTREDLALLFGVESRVVRGRAGRGTIGLVIDQRLKGEAYEIEVNDRVVIRGGSYQGVAWGLATLLQSAGSDKGRVILPRLKIFDQPYARYRGLSIDLARQWHPIEVVRQVVALCHWYKIGYLQLHLTDHESWTFPSTAYPKLATPGRQYALQELRDLEALARARGVVIVPELEVPGHSGALARALPDVVGMDPFSDKAICPGRESTYVVLDTLIEEVAKVFTSTPYFHLGCDEVDKSVWVPCKYCREYRKLHGVEDEEELYRHFIVRMNDIVKKHGKQMMVWEGFKVTGKITIPKEITVMEFESFYELPQNLLAAGYQVINTAWQPLYVVNERNWSPEKLLSWNMYRWEHWWDKSQAYPDGIDVTETPLVMGAQLCAWEQPPDLEIPSLRQRLAAMSECVWDHRTRRSFADFSIRLQSTDAKLTKLLAAGVSPIVED